jgi:cell division septal protein FtsQ
MKRRRSRNKSLTTSRERRKQYFVEGVVKRGSSETWGAFRRWTGHLIKLTFIAALCVGAYYGSTEGFQTYFWRNPTYLLKEVGFTTDGSLTRQQAIDVTKFHPGNNILSYNLEAAREALAKLPQVDHSRIRRYLPNRIEITVVERKPVAWVSSAQTNDPDKARHSHLLDARALVFQPRNIPHEYNSLPVIGGVELGDLEPGKPLRKAEVVATIELLHRVGATSQFKARAIDVSKGYCFVVTDQKNSQLTFGLDDIDGQLRRLMAVEGEATLIGQEIQTINLIPSRNVPVTFKIPPAPESDELDAPEPSQSAKSKGPLLTKPGNAISKDKTQPAAKKIESQKPKETPRKESNGMLKRFHQAA